VAAFETSGYVECVDRSFEAGFEKVASYTLNGQPTHASRQRAAGKWVSKLGDGYDVEHTEDAVSSGIYGKIEKYMKRPVNSGN
jgi:hypothetical protein